MKTLHAQQVTAMLLAGTALLAMTAPASADPTAPCNDAAIPNTTECGSNANAAAAGATAIGAGTTATVMPGQRFGVSGGLGYYNDRVAGSTSVAYRISNTTVLTSGVGIGFDSGEVGARAGFQSSW